METKKQTTIHPRTLVAQAMGEICTLTGAVIPPIQVATTYARDSNYEVRDGRSYIRDSSPTVEQAEKIICKLEQGEQGMLFPSGLSACTAAFHGLKNGDHIVLAQTLYHGVTAWVQEFAGDYGLSVSYFDSTNASSLEKVIEKGKTKVVWVEIIANPTWVVADVNAIAEITHGAGAQLAVDATACTPVLCQPLNHGADLVCHSATKYLNGHSDVLAGVIVCKDSQSPLWQRIKKYRYLAGPMPSARDSYELIRGMKTLYLRVNQQCENALAIAKMLAQHEAVEKVYYPGLESSSFHNIAKKQFSGGFGGMLSILVKGTKEQTIGVVLATKLWKPATSLGGVESLIEHRKTSEGDITNTPDNLIRLSTGIEHVDDLIADLDQALKIVSRDS